MAVAILVPLGFFAMIVLLVYFGGARAHRERMEMINRGMIPVRPAGAVPGGGVLITGLLLVAIGLGVLLSMMFSGGHLDGEELGLTLAILFGGIAFLVYYGMTGKQREHARKRYNRLVDQMTGLESSGGEQATEATEAGEAGEMEEDSR